MTKYLLIFFLLLVLQGVVNGCFWSSSKSSPTTTTTTTHSPPIAVDEFVQAINIKKSTSAKSSITTKVDTAELRRFSEELYRLSSNSVRSKLSVNYQGKTSSSATNDAASGPLISDITSDSLTGLTYTRFNALLDNYIANVNIDEVNTKQERTEKNVFLEALAQTNIIKETHKFLKKKGLLNVALRDALDVIWFTPYSRSRGKVGSSGFEHVFLGEIKDGKVSGFHNWLYFSKEEKLKNLNYKGYMKILSFGNKGEIVKLRFDWLTKAKPIGSMFVGTSPELEIALYTICFYARPNANCNLQMNDKRFSIKVYTQKYGGKTLVGSAFPSI